MDLDENGKERRNALLASAALFSAAYLKLGLPSFLATYIKLDIPSGDLFKVWVLAAVLAFYVLMRYHYSGSRSRASRLEKASFAEAWLLKHKNSVSLNECAAQAHKALASHLKNFNDHTQTNHYLSLNQIDPADIGVSKPDQYWVKWRLSEQFRASHEAALGSFSPVAFSALKIKPTWKFYFWRVLRQSMWSSKAWEVNTTYLLCAAAVCACLGRAADGAGGWLALVKSFI